MRHAVTWRKLNAPKPSETGWTLVRWLVAIAAVLLAFSQGPA